MTAYVLLAYLSQPQVSSADMGTASRIVRWLSKQQNPYGGFASTQVPVPGFMGWLHVSPHPVAAIRGDPDLVLS